MPKILKKIFKTIIDILIFIIFLILIVIIFAKLKMLKDNNNYFELFGYSIFNVATGSMEPAISQNDVILVKKQDNYKLNDIITFKKDKDFITHRIIKINDTYITTKGDANNAIDVAITQDVIIGKVIKIYENAGIWQKILTTPQVVVMIFVTLILFDLAFSYKGFKNKQLVKKVDQVDLEQVAKKSHDFKFNKEEIKALYNKMDLIKKNKDIELNNKEKELLEYTIRLDLSELQKEINDKLNKEE